jgi:cephalosporin-C deacetylase-like acetyl esterase
MFPKACCIRPSILCLSFVATFPGVLSAQKELDVIKGKWVQYSDPSHLLYHHLSEEAFGLLDRHTEGAKKVTTRAQWQQRQKETKAAIWKAIGPFPEKTPLNATVTSVVEKEDFTVENVIYESLPGYYVTASLFIPKQIQKPAPAILFCSGHSAAAYRRDVYQLPLQNLVKKGFVVLAIDPVSQGERLQYLNREKGESEIGSSTKEHSYPTVQSFLIGQSTARYFVWDGIRGIDYLLSRKEVDQTRLGVHGLSGGGTQAAYIGALDDRVLASAPSGYITGFRRLIESIGVQDGEQNFFHGIKEGIDHADLLEVRAPKPTLVMATTRDFFNISGTRDVFQRVKRVYDLFGATKNFEMVEGDYEHGYEQNIREGMYGFFQKHLNLPGSAKELPITLLTEKELQKTSTGQIASSFATYETVFSLNKKQAEPLINKLTLARGSLKQRVTSVVAKAKEVSGFRAPVDRPNPVFTGRIQKEGYVIERYFIKGEGAYPVPYLLFVPKVKNGKTVIYVHPEGKAKEASGEIEKIVNSGFSVLAPDLLGVGELTSAHTGDAMIGGVSYNVWFTSALTGRSIVGTQASDLIRLISVIKQRNAAEEVWGVAYGSMGPSLLHAAAFDARLAKVAVSGMYNSYQAVVENERYQPSYVYSMVAGALKFYDLQDLAAAIAPRVLLLDRMVSTNGSLLQTPEVKGSYQVAIAAYSDKKAGQALTISTDVQLPDWLRAQNK